MIQAVDTRDFSYNHPIDARASNLIDLPGEGAAIVNEVNAMTGAPSQVTFTGMQAGAADPVDLAVELATLTSRSFGASGEAPAEFVPDPHVLKTTQGAMAVHLHQHHRGIPIFEMNQVVRFASDGSPKEVVGSTVTLPASTPLDPTIDVRDAALAAAQYLASHIDTSGAQKDPFGQPLATKPLDISRFAPQILGTVPLPSRPAVLEPGPFADPIPAHLVLFYQGPTTRLGWQLLFSMPEHQGQYSIIVGADGSAAEILYCKETSWSAHATALVYRHNPSEADREPIEMPPPRSFYPVRKSASPLPEDFPSDWVASAETSGNCTIACLGETQTTYRGRVVDGTVAFEPANDSDEQELVNIFYFCNYMHDFFYMLGFDEEAGNFQQRNFSRRGLASDPVIARAHPRPIWGTANMLTLPDGQTAEMNMGLVAQTGRHTALDADVVFHEFVHGVTNRLVGGRLNARALEQPQSRGMGEGWGDYFALTIQNHGRDKERTAVGSWVVANPRGIRGHLYNESFPDDFGKIGAGRYREEHNIGEIWCATLIQMNRNLGEALGSKEEGHELGWQLVVDALKITPANPSFLDARNAILRQLDEPRATSSGQTDEAQLRALRTAVWRAFARFGMGPNARSSGASLGRTQPDFNMPTGLECAPS